MRLVAAFSVAFTLALGFVGCSAADGNDTNTDPESAEQEEAVKVCPYVVPECYAPCKLVGHCPQKCQCPNGATPCGTNVCYGNQTCCTGMPFLEPTCINGDICPISRAKYKTEIDYVSDAEAKKLHDDLVDMPLASYRYKSEEQGARRHLGFIIDDVAPSPAVDASGERVDLYGYTTMAVAALKVQAKELAELKRQVADLRREAEQARSSCSCSR